LKIEQKLGEGTFGIVWKATYNKSAVAEKQIKEGNNMNELAKQSFLSEVELMKTGLQPHRNVVTFIGYCLNPLCLITEYLPHGSLLQLLITEPLDLKMKIQIIVDVATGMYHLSQQRIVHNDLAARNVLLGEGMVAKVADFGMSRELQTSEKLVSMSDVGPLKWMAPEALTKGIYSSKSDCWSFGVLCIEILSDGKPPFPELSVAEFALKFHKDELASKMKYQIPKGTPTSLTDVVELCFEIEADNRPTFKDLCEKLETIQQQQIY